MHFDDRLATVLRQSVKGSVVARVQFRQLVDLLGSHPDENANPAIQSGFERLTLLGRHIPASDRARILGEPGVKLRSTRILAQLAGDEPAVASAAISAARLEEDEWLALIPDLPVRARGQDRSA